MALPPAVGITPATGTDQPQAGRSSVCVSQGPLNYQGSPDPPSPGWSHSITPAGPAKDGNHNRGCGTRGPVPPNDGHTPAAAVNATAYSIEGYSLHPDSSATEAYSTSTAMPTTSSDDREAKQLSDSSYTCINNYNTVYDTAYHGYDWDQLPGAHLGPDVLKHDIPHHRTYSGVWYPRPFVSHLVPDEYCRVYDAAVAGRAANHTSAKVVVPSRLNIDMWKHYTTNHQEDRLVIDGITYGFPLQYMGGPQYQSCAVGAPYSPTPNHSSAVRYPAAVEAYLAKEIEEKAMLGPFPQPPFTPWCQVSPLMSRPKPNGTERRIIVDLSYPDGGINAHIQKNVIDGVAVQHNLPTIRDALALVHEQGIQNAHMSAIDISRAYRNFRTSPEDWPLLAISYDGQYFADLALPFGARMSSYYMQAIARFIQRALANIGYAAVIYLDDILIVSPDLCTAIKAHRAALQILADLGLPVADKKLIPPARELVWLGLHIDLDANMISIPDAKLHEIKSALSKAANMTSIPTKHMQSIIGYINHLGKAVEPARLFMSRLLEAMREARGGDIVVSDEVKADLEWFRLYLSTYNGKNIIKHDSVDWVIEADACLKGFGAHDGDRCYSTHVTESMAQSHSISRLECINCLMAVRTFVGAQHRGMTILVKCDNEATVYTYMWGRAKDRVMSACARAMWYEAASKDVVIKVVHVPGVLMTVADALSRAPISSEDANKADRIKLEHSLREIKPNRKLMMYSRFL